MFKFRYSDSQIGRFHQIDPLNEDFPHNSTYALQENKVTEHIELDGLEAVLVFNTQKEEYSGLSKSLNALARSGIMRELIKEFATDNKRTDVYLNVSETFPSGTNGSTGIYEGQDNSKQTQQLSLTDIRADNPNLKNNQLKSILNQTLSENKGAIIIKLNKEDVVAAGNDKESQNKLSLTIVHELKAHTIDLKDGVNNINGTGLSHKNDRVLVTPK